MSTIQGRQDRRLPGRPDRWRAQGAIFLNAGLTITKFKPGGSPEQKYGHIPLWQPFVAHLLKSLAQQKPFFIESRSASLGGGKAEGYFGEIHPSVLSNFGIEMPVAAFEVWFG